MEEIQQKFIRLIDGLSFEERFGAVNLSKTTRGGRGRSVVTGIQDRDWRQRVLESSTELKYMS